MKLVILCFLVLFTMKAYPQTSHDINCEIVNRPINCKRLTEQECEHAKREQERLNINRKMLCNAKVVEEMIAGNGNGNGNGAGNGNGTGNEGQAQSSETSDGEADAANDVSEIEEQESVTQINQSTETTTEATAGTPSGRSAGGPKWGTGTLCEKFKVAYEKAETEEARKTIQRQAEEYNCG